MNLWVIFLTGLTVGGLTCLAVQGGLLASVIAAREKEYSGKKTKSANYILPTFVFLVSKLVIHLIFGFLLGAFGNVVGISQTAQIIMQLIAGLYMLAVALNLLNVHPIFRYAIIQPPKFFAKKIRNQSKSKDIFAPMILGFMTVFIPCGTTLAMEALAVSSANPIVGAAIMAAFVLGTVPLFFGIGWITAIMGDNYKNVFLKIAAIAIIYLGISSINGALIAGGFPLNSHTLITAISSLSNSDNEKLYSKVPITQNVEILVTAGGYSPNYIKVRKDVPVNLKLIGMNNYSCASAFRIPAYGISKNLSANETFNINFTPKTKGRVLFSCSMGMYTGIIEVI